MFGMMMMRIVIVMHLGNTGLVRLMTRGDFLTTERRLGDKVLMRSALGKQTGELSSGKRIGSLALVRYQRCIDATSSDVRENRCLLLPVARLIHHCHWELVKEQFPYIDHAQFQRGQSQANGSPCPHDRHRKSIGRASVVYERIAEGLRDGGKFVRNVQTQQKLSEQLPEYLSLVQLRPRGLFVRLLKHAKPVNKGN
jgi:hypothetical protein